MSTQKILLGTLIATVFGFGLDFLWYGVIMQDFFGTSAVSLNPPNFPWLILGILIMAYAFCRIYVKGYEENKTLVAQGINYGILVFLLVFVPHALISYATTTIAPLNHHLIDLLYRVIQMIVLGIIIAKFFGSISVKPGGGHGGGA